jgi:putative quorum-sensing-regulated virulence factor
MKMPFGRWRGFQIEDLPTEYLIWLAKRVDLSEPLRSEVQFELIRRKREQGQIAALIEQEACPR